MTAIQHKIFEEALSLPVDLRTNLVEQLLSSLNVPSQSEIDKMWKQEAEFRVAQIENNEVELIEGEEVFSRIREKYKQ